LEVDAADAPPAVDRSAPERREPSRLPANLNAMRPKTAIAIATTAGSLALWGAGCGGSDATTSTITSSSSTTTTAVATDEFITAADARCAEANAAIANLVAEGSASSTVIQQQIDITKQTLKGLKSLGTPEDPDGSLNDFYDAVKQQISVLGQQQSALASGDSAAADTLGVQLDQAESDAQTAAVSFGFEECGQQGSALSTDSSTTGSPSDAATTTTPVTPTTTPAPTPAPVTPAPSGGTSGGTSSGGTSGGGSGGSGNSGGISPGG